MTRLVAVFMWLLLCLFLSATTYANDKVNAHELMEKNFLVSKVSGFKANVTMLLVNDQGQERVRKLGMWSKLKIGGIDAEVMMRFEEPVDIKGTGFLQIENSIDNDSIWVYLPALGKSRRLVSSNKRDSFFGTDFSYGDILLPAVDKYDHTYVRAETFEGSECYVVESKPHDAKTRDESGYSRKIEWLDAKNYLERKVEYYDLSDKILKTQRTFDIQLVEPDQKRWMPMRREMVNHQTGHKTIYKFDNFALDKKLSDSIFSVRSLEL